MTVNRSPWKKVETRYSSSKAKESSSQVIQKLVHNAWRKKWLSKANTVSQKNSPSYTSLPPPSLTLTPPHPRHKRPGSPQSALIFPVSLKFMSNLKNWGNRNKEEGENSVVSVICCSSPCQIHNCVIIYWVLPNDAKSLSLPIRCHLIWFFFLALSINHSIIRSLLRSFVPLFFHLSFFHCWFIHLFIYFIYSYSLS